MRLKKVTLKDLSAYEHPSVKLFRAIELGTVYETFSKFSFKNPVLDLGCGDGFITAKLFEGKFKYGLDNNEAGDVRIAKDKNIFSELLIESATNMSLSDKSVNFVFSNSVIEHIPDIDSVIDEVSRVLKRNGVFLFTVPSKYFSEYLYVSSILNSVKLSFLANIYVKFRNNKLNHYHLYDDKKWKDLLEERGLEIIKFKYYLSEEAIQLWDKMAWEVKLDKIFDKHSEKKVLEKYSKKIHDQVLSDKVKDNKGAGIVILAKKK